MAASTSEAEVYYDPYDTGIDDDPYPVWRRLRDEAPLYHNEKLGFYALSRWDDVEAALLDWDTYRSGRGTILDVLRAKVEIPPGILLWEDPPLHDLHRGLLTRVFTPKRMNAIEPMVRRYCAGLLDRLIDADEFDVIADFGALVPMRTIGFLLGIPEEGQEAVRRNVDERLRVGEGGPPAFDPSTIEDSHQLFAEYIDWRAANPSDDLMTQLLHAEIDENGRRRRLTRSETLGYTAMIAGAGNETAARLIGLDEMLKRWRGWDVDYARAYKAHTTSVRGWASLPIRTKRIG